MSWLESYQESELLASKAEAQIRARNYSAAEQLYQRAANLEMKAFSDLDGSKPRTLGIIGVSAAALLFKSKNFSDTERFAIQALNHPALPQFARFQLRQILQDAWVEQDKVKNAQIAFLPGQVQVSAHWCMHQNAIG